MRDWIPLRLKNDAAAFASMLQSTNYTNKLHIIKTNAGWSMNNLKRRYLEASYIIKNCMQSYTFSFDALKASKQASMVIGSTF